MNKISRAARDPANTDAYLVGGGIASLAAAVHLYHDAHVPADQIHIIEASPVPGGSMGGSGDWKKGYMVRAARKLNFSYSCLYDTLSRVPSAKNASKTVLDDISDSNRGNEKRHEGGFRARLVATTPAGPEMVDARSVGLSTEDRLSLLGLVLGPEDKVVGDEVQAHFGPAFFETKFWDMWSSMYAFQPWSSAVEFRRYLHRFLHELSNLGTMAGTEHTPMNDYESVVVPIENHLKDLGVDFRYETKVTSVLFHPGDDISVSALHIDSKGQEGTVGVGPSDIVLITLGSMTANSLVGDNKSPPPPPPDQETVIKNPDPVWRFWAALADPKENPHAESFGRPETFYNRLSRSAWLSFTVTLVDACFLDRLREWSGTTDGSLPLVTFRDCPWMLSITVPHQPYFVNQPENVHVLWGYGLYPDQRGTFVKKPMMKCSGEEILTELLHHLDLPLQPTLEQSTTIPCLMPYIGSPLLTRRKGDRPEVVPAGSRSLGLLGQFVEMDRDVTFTTEYSVRAAQTAVFQLMGLDKEPPPVHRGEESAQVLGEALMTIMS